MSKTPFAKKILILILILCAITVSGASALYFTVSKQTAPAVQNPALSDSASGIPESAVSDAEALSPAQTPESPEESSEEPEPEPEPAEYTISLMAVGDNLMHMGIVNTGRQDDGTYNYDFLFQNISPFLAAADVKIINQETILGGNELGFSGFPYFNSPTEVGDGIAAAGFNVVLHASNHSADQGEKGLKNCIAFWETHPEVLLTGIHDKPAPQLAEEIEPPSDEEDVKTSTESSARTFPTVTVGDVTFIILNYTYGPNMEVIPSAIQGYLDILCSYNEKSGLLDFTTLNPHVTEDIAMAKEQADVVVVCPHWGTEYSSVPSKYQKEFAAQMTEAGADLIIGTHPHVVQPVEWIESENGNRALCYYSLGNYVSTQKKPLSMLEGMAWVTFQVHGDEIAILDDRTGVIPLVCHYTTGPVRLKDVYLLEEYTEEQAAAHGIRYYGEAPLTMDKLLQWQEEILGDFVISAQDALQTDLSDSADSEDTAVNQ